MSIPPSYYGGKSSTITKIYLQGMSMEHKKYSIKLGYLVLMWYGLAFGNIFVIAVLVIYPIDIFVKKNPIGFGESIFVLLIFLFGNYKRFATKSHRY